MGRLTRLLAIGAQGLLVVGGTLAMSPAPHSTELQLERTATTVPVDRTVALKAVAVNGSGEVVPGLSAAGVRWSTAATGPARLSPSTGAATTFSASRPGRYEITATLGSVRKTLVIQVVPASPTRAIPVTDLVLRAPSARLGSLLGVRDLVPTGMPVETAVREAVAPLYPGARLVAARVNHYPAPYTNSWYLIAAPVRTFVVEASQSTVDQWYRWAFAALGYQPDGQGGGGPTRLYAFSRDPANPDAETIGIQTTAVSQGTRVVYGASAVAVPARPAASLLPAKARALRVSFWSGTGDAPVRFTLTRHGIVAQLVQTLNAIPLAQTETRVACGLSTRGQGIQVSVASPRGPYPAVSLWEFCDGDVIGSTQVAPPSSFWLLAELLAKGYGPLQWSAHETH